MPLTCLLATATAVVVADLPDHADGDQYNVRIARVLNGEIQPGPLDVLEPAPWRGTPPQFRTREALMFLRRDDNGLWRVLGPSGEGRIALGDGWADVRGIAFPLARPTTGNYDRGQLLDALASAGRCFAFTANEELIHPHARCDSGTMAQESMHSSLHRALLESLALAQESGLVCRF